MRLNLHQKPLKSILLTAMLSLSLLNVAQASVIFSDLIIDAETVSDMLPGDVSSGDFSLIQGGVTFTSTYSDGVVAPGDDNPLGGSLSDTGDGIGFTGSATSDGEYFFAGFDGFMTIENDSALVYDIVLKLIFGNSVTANGDAFADSEFYIEANGSEVFFSDLLVDTVFGNEIAGVATDPETFGGTLDESGTVLLPFVLNPTEILDLVLFWTAEGQDYGVDGAAFSFSQFLSIDSAVARTAQPPTDVPAPSIVLLFLLTFAGFVARSTKTKN